MNIAGIISGLLGIGSGALKVIAMDNIMRIPFKVSTTTSNFLIRVTAAASVVIYMKRDYIPRPHYANCFRSFTGCFCGVLSGD
ncbi:sulfite exporter TauE/SafE family protein [Flavihumibacter fluvii]|nr:sulfite exporter TauE/SafE family protein [Flavihumibacter fluvii]ULQ54841.1 sulfite exporter TauE/SafE family protein [Flavihumibacter fluvii]